MRYLLIVALALIAGSLLIFTGPRASSTELLRGQLINNTLQDIARNYLEPNRIDPKEMLKGSLDQIERLVPEILVTYPGNRIATVTVGIATKKFRLGKVSSLLDLQRNLFDILRFVDQHYTGDIEKEKIEYAAIEGMLAELDPHSAFLSPKVYREFKVGTRGEFGGLGIVISIKDGNLTVVSPLEGTPAWRKGIKAGDKIIQIGDESTINMSLTDAVNKLRGKVRTNVRIVISRPGIAAPFPVTITRAIINIDSVQKLMLAENDKRIGYIKLKSFQANTNSDFSAALDEFHRGGSLDGLILDMRNNPGGLLNQALDIADHFLTKGTIVTTVGPRGILMDKEIAHPLDAEQDYPVIVLINEGAASASEIVAGALKAHDRAVVMGHRSFGKGSVQTIFEIGNDSAVKLTIAKYLPAGTMSIQSAGVTPDVELVPKTVAKEHMDLVDDVVHSEKDLEKHLGKEAEKLEKAEYRTSYYQPYEKSGDDREQQFREYTAKPDVKNDFAVQLAKKLLATVSSSSRKTMLKEFKAPLAASEKEQERIIDEHLAKLGIDWSPVAKGKKSLLQIAYNIRRGNANVKQVRAGSEIDLELTATNIGKGTYGRLVAVGQAKSPLLRNLEFVFGKLKPGERRSWRVPLTIPESMSSQDLMIEIEFHEEHGNTPEPLNAVLPVRGLARPRFAFKYRLIERAPNRNLASNKDLHLAVTAYNVGKGTSSAETVMTLANKSGSKLFIKKGRAALGAMKPGASRSSTFLFRIGRDFSERDAKLELTILDPKTLSILNKPFTVEVMGGTLSPKGNVRYQPPSIALSQTTPQTSKPTYTLTGAIRDTDEVRDYYLFVGNKKVAYAANPLNSKEMALNAVLPLEEGNNIVSIAARDKFDLIGHKTIVINRSDERQ